MNKFYNYTLTLVAMSTPLSWMNSVFAAPAPIITSTQERLISKDNSFGLGFTTSVAQRPFIGVNDQSASLPYFSYQNGRFYVEGLDVGLNVMKSKGYSLDLLATPRFYEVKESFADNGELSGIEETKQTYFAGISSQIRTDFAIYTLQILHDVIDSDGNELVFQAAKPFKLSKSFTLTPSVGLTYQDKNLVGHYYGVQSNEVAADRQQYDGKASLNPNISFNASWSLTKHIELLGQFKFESLDSGIKNSPIIDKTSISTYTVGAVYRF